MKSLCNLTLIVLAHFLSLFTRSWSWDLCFLEDQNIDPPIQAVGQACVYKHGMFPPRLFKVQDLCNVQNIDAYIYYLPMKLKQSF